MLLSDVLSLKQPVAIDVNELGSSIADSSVLLLNKLLPKYVPVKLDGSFHSLTLLQ